MQRHVVLSLCCSMIVASGYAGEAKGLDTKKTEADTDKDGKADVRMEVVSRDSQRAMMVMSRADKNGKWKVTARSFYVGPHMGMTETDDDGDGFFEMFVVYRENPEDVNAFVRERDGSVRPADTKIVDGLRKQTAVLTEFWSKPVRDPDKMGAAIGEVREKMKKIAEEAGKAD